MKSLLKCEIHVNITAVIYIFFIDCIMKILYNFYIVKYIFPIWQSNFIKKNYGIAQKS